ncbi:MAG: DUF2628 domain-containing protein [Ruminococcus sp.]|jgi:hypothetical protein|nr:DUF2628 domain-containing protein [Ruminococcus sp.]
MEFIGKTCSVCHNLFEIDDVPVVCPYCGKPFHRECYMEVGGKICPVCDNKGLPQEEDISDMFDEVKSILDDIKIPPPQYFDQYGNPVSPPPPQYFDQYGNPVPPPKYFDQYGNPIPPPQYSNPNMQNNPNQSPPPNEWNSGDQNKIPAGGAFFNLLQMLDELEKIKREKQNYDLSETVTNGEFEKFIKTGVDEYLINFRKFFKERKNFSFNFIAFIWPEIYFAYRKMYLWWAISLIFAFINAIPTLITMAGITVTDTPILTLLNLSTGLGWFFKIAMMAFANFLFYKHCEKSINNIKKENQNNTERAYQIYGGVSFLNVGICLALQMVIAVSGYFLLDFFLK